jgi:hypothetical protein
VLSQVIVSQAGAIGCRHECERVLWCEPYVSASEGLQIRCQALSACVVMGDCECGVAKQERSRVLVGNRVYAMTLRSTHRKTSVLRGYRGKSLVNIVSS